MGEAVRYDRGSDLPSLGIKWEDSSGALIDFSTGYTFTVKVGPKRSPSVTSFTKTTGITGAATSPNVTIAWATTGELNALEPGPYTVQIIAARTSDSAERIMDTDIEIMAPFVAAVVASPPAGTVVCQLWAQPSDLGSGPWSSTEAVAALAEASDVLYAFSGRQFSGLCTDVVRPCSSRAGHDAPPVAIPGFYIGNGVPHLGPAGWGVAPSGLWGGCDCSGAMFGRCCRSRIRLGAEPVVSITQVLIDGLVVNPAAYQIDEGRYLAAVPSPVTNTMQGWPCCQCLDCDAGDVVGYTDTYSDTYVVDVSSGSTQRTFQVTYVFGRVVPVGGKAAAIALATQILKAGSGDDCQLPANVQQLIRQGVTLSMGDPSVVFSDGRTGIKSVDRWLASVNPHKIRERARVLSPDVPRASVHVRT